jgi:S1-C subfamily serine protease
MRNQPCYLTTGGGNRPESLPTPFSRATTPVRRALLALEGEATPRFFAAVTALALLIALTLAAVVVHVAVAPHYRAGAALRTTPTLAVASSPPAGTQLAQLAAALPSAAATTSGDSVRGRMDAIGSARSTTEFTASEAARLALRTAPGLVDITTGLRDGSGEAGTGIVLRGSGLVLTAAHVVTGAVTIRAVDLGDGQDYPATLIGVDLRHDVALIQLHGASGLHLAHLADSDTTAQVGDQVLSIGNAYGRGYPTITTGPVTALGQTISAPALPGHRMGGLIAADNSILPGQSGGPMLNRAGAVIGMNDAYQLTQTGGSPTGIGYAVPISTALHVAHTLLAHHNKLARA